MAKKYEEWYADITYPNGEMDREFYNTLAMTLKYAMRDSRANKTVIGRVYGDFKRIDTIDYPVFGILHKVSEKAFIYIGKVKPTDRTDKTYRVYANGSLKLITSR